jgi:hypothetical protein
MMAGQLLVPRRTLHIIFGCCQKVINFIDRLPVDVDSGADCDSLSPLRTNGTGQPAPTTQKYCTVSPQNSANLTLVQVGVMKPKYSRHLFKGGCVRGRMCSSGARLWGKSDLQYRVRTHTRTHTRTVAAQSTLHRAAACKRPLHNDRSMRQSIQHNITRLNN